MTALFISLSTSAQIPTDGLLGHWSFNGNANDESGNNNDGTVNGAALTSDRFGNNNCAYYFDGNNDFINTNLISGITNGLSISLWIKSDNTNDWSGVITSRGFVNDFSGFSILPEGNICFYINTYTYVLTTDYNILDNNWKFIVGTYDGNNLRLYINDTLVGSTSSNENVSVPDFYKIGKDEISSDRYLNGYIDDVCIYNRALNESEISAMYYNYTCIISSTSDTTEYHVSNSNFEKESPKIYLETIDSLISNDGCDSLIYHYSKYTYDPTVCTFYDSITVTDTLIIDVLLTRIQPLEDDINTLKAYPNPAKDFLIINTGNYSEMIDYSIKIVNELGETVFETEITQPSYEINLSTWTGKGVYVLLVSDNNNVIKATKKIILQ
jgi:hypothetical protein